MAKAHSVRGIMKKCRFFCFLNSVHRFRFRKASVCLISSRICSLSIRKQDASMILVWMHPVPSVTQLYFEIPEIDYLNAPTLLSLSGLRPSNLASLFQFSSMAVFNLSNPSACILSKAAFHSDSHWSGEATTAFVIMSTA